MISLRHLFEALFTPETKDTAKKVGIGAALGGVGLMAMNAYNSSKGNDPVSSSKIPSVPTETRETPTRVTHTTNSNVSIPGGQQGMFNMNRETLDRHIATKNQARINAGLSSSNIRTRIE